MSTLLAKKNVVGVVSFKWTWAARDWCPETVRRSLGRQFRNRAWNYQLCRPKAARICKARWGACLPLDCWRGRAAMKTRCGALEGKPNATDIGSSSKRPMQEIGELQSSDIAALHEFALQ